jgi:hypothetical protein
MKKTLRLLTLAFAASSIGVAIVIAQTHGQPEKFTAFAVNLDGTAVAPAGASVVDIVVERYSTDAERDRLLNILMAKGPEKLLDTLQSLPRVGYIRTPNSLAYDLHYARKTPMDEGGERIVLVTDRYIGFWEAANRPRTIDYPFTVIELRLNRDGEGEGKMSIATKITVDREHSQIELENYGAQPVLLTTVRRVAG